VAKTVSEEETQLRKRARRRLVGSITLVIAAVVILPMVLDSKPEQRIEEIDIRIPSEDAVDELGTEPEASGGTSGRTTPDTDTSRIQAENEAPNQAPNRAAQQSSAKPVAPAKEAVEKPHAAGTAETGSSLAPSSATGRAKGTASPVNSELFVVQLGAFTDPAKAGQKLQSLRAKDIASIISAEAYTETIKAEKGLDKNVEKGVGKGDITRVRVGPFRSREEAENAREKLKTLGFSGVVADK
jgi:DedD protein